MKKTLLILCALLLTAVGASAQTTAYEFKNTDWAATNDHSTVTNVTYGDDNTITVTASGDLNVALSNSPTAKDGSETDGITTGNYYITQDQTYFVVVGTNLSTTAGDLWWMNGTNLGGVVPNITTLSDGKILFVWNLSNTTVFPNETNAFEGWTCFALTSTTGTSVISDICFYTLEEAVTKYPELEDVLHHDAIPYEFHAEDWVSLDLSRLTADGITYNADNTITVAVTGSQNVALGNSLTYSNSVAGITTDGYYITSDQTCFVIVGTGLSTTDISALWWLNGVNANVTASTPISLSDGQTLFYWDFSENTQVMAKFDDGKMVIDGWTGGGLTATGEATTISYIGFCKPSEATSSFTVPTNTYAHACTANESVWSTTTTLPSGEYVRLDTWATQSDEKMSTPFMEYYADNDAYLSGATINHDQLTGLTAGVYEVSMDIRIIDFAKDGDNNAKIGAGTKFIANGVSEDILTGSDGTEDEYDTDGHDEVYGTYTLTCVVDNTGTLDISLDVKDATYSWIMWKNLKVKYLETATISWEMTSAGWGTMILPFAADVPTTTDEGETATLTLYAGEALTLDSDGTTIMVGTAAETIAANTPYLVKGTAGTYTFSGTYVEATGALTSGMLTGTLVDMTYSDFTANSGQYVLQNQESGLAFYQITSESTGVELGAYHCYLSTNTNFLALHLPGMETGIVAVEGAETLANDAIYDLSGRRVSKAVKGVYIQNGKKVLVK